MNETIEAIVVESDVGNGGQELKAAFCNTTVRFQIDSQGRNLSFRAC